MNRLRLRLRLRLRPCPCLCLCLCLCLRLWLWVWNAQGHLGKGVSWKPKINSLKFVIYWHFWRNWHFLPKMQLVKKGRKIMQLPPKQVCGAITWLSLWTSVCLLEYYFVFPPTGPERLVHFLPHCFHFCWMPLLSWRLQFVILYFRWEWFKHGFYVLMKDIYGSNTKVIEIRNKNPVLNLFPQT